MTFEVSAPIGILGGTFDPIHYGHLRLAVEAAEACGLAEVRLVPAGTPPHRAAPVAPAWQRLQMARLACTGWPRLRVDDREVFKDAPCYTVDTLTELRAEVGPGMPLALIVGADAFIGLDTWHRWGELFALAHLIVAQRPGYELDGARGVMAEPLCREYAARRAAPAALRSVPAGRIVVIAITALDISASRLRRCIAAEESVRYLLPDSVLDYIQANHLYSGAR